MTDTVNTPAAKTEGPLSPEQTIRDASAARQLWPGTNNLEQ
jgi:hypothetical protein